MKEAHSINDSLINDLEGPVLKTFVYGEDSIGVERIVTVLAVDTVGRHVEGPDRAIWNGADVSIFQVLLELSIVCIKQAGRIRVLPMPKNSAGGAKSPHHRIKNSGVLMRPKN